VRRCVFFPPSRGSQELTWKIYFTKEGYGYQFQERDFIMGQWFSGGQVYDFLADALIFTTTIDFFKMYIIHS